MSVLPVDKTVPVELECGHALHIHPEIMAGATQFFCRDYDDFKDIKADLEFNRS
jgi:hypothetical protein